jgi:SAM-dependent methyltransferase
MTKHVGARAFLKGEGFEFGLRPDRLRERLMRQLDVAQRKQLDDLALLDDGPVRSHGLYNLPNTLRQAHLLFSNDADRTAVSFDWLAEVATYSNGAVIDLGSGSGAFLRLLAARGNAQPLLGIDSSPSLVEIATNNSAGAPNAQFYLLNFAEVATLGRKFELVTSACALNWTSLENDRGNDIPLDLCMPDQFALSPAVKEKVAGVAGQFLLNTRRVTTSGGRLATVERMRNMQEIIAFLIVAAEAGWRFDIKLSKKLRALDEVFPALLFDADEPHSFQVDLRNLVTWWQGSVSSKLPVADEAAILAYQDLGAVSRDVRQLVFPNGTMIEETGFLADGRAYSYRYATTGFRELRLL